MENDRSCRGRIVADVDVERIRREARGLATDVGFDRHDAEAIFLAVSELATNLMRTHEIGRQLRNGKKNRFRIMTIEPDIRGKAPCLTPDPLDVNVSYDASPARTVVFHACRG